MRQADREEMLRTIEEEFALTRHLTGRATPTPEVLAAMGQVPRDEFVPEDLRREAFANHPLPIGAGQTISQPFIVALMTDLLEPRPQDRVLEVGTGSGYQAAILSQLVRSVYSVEIVPALAESAARRLERLGYGNVAARRGDGYLGWAEHAPYDGIVVTAAAPYVPPALVEQLRPGGRLVIPVGQPYQHQELLLVVKDESGQRQTTRVLTVAFVPLVGSH